LISIICDFILRKKKTLRNIVKAVFPEKRQKGKQQFFLETAVKNFGDSFLESHSSDFRGFVLLPGL
jgi:hypothetical protein